MEGELEFARTLFKMNPCMMRNSMDMRAWDWASEMVRADEAGVPGLGSIELALGAAAVDDRGYNEATTWGPATIRPIL
eukprot:3344277-Heterocapsa_arctica.AAC.1